ncbi:MAG: 30S ribosomal protein S20 [Aquificae bacterium]|nr:30S ribosomal protein S20 [Aquificota bacterium]
MPNTRQAKKRMRRDARRRLRNRYHLSRMRTYIRNFRRMLERGELERAKEYINEVVSVIQHTASKGVIHKREAARRVSRLYHHLNKALQQQAGSQA